MTKKTLSIFLFFLLTLSSLCVFQQIPTSKATELAFGHTTPNTESGITMDRMYGSAFQPNTVLNYAKIKSISWYGGDSATDAWIKALVLDSERHILGISDRVIINDTTTRWYNHTFSTPIEISSSETYYLCIIPDSNIELGEVTGGTSYNRYIDTSNDYTSPSDPTDFVSPLSGEYCIYATCTKAQETLTLIGDSHVEFSEGNQTIDYYDYGDVSFTGTTGYHISHVYVNGVEQFGQEDLLGWTSRMFTNYTISVTSAINTYTLTPIVDGHSIISPSTAQTVNYGGSKEFTYSADAGYSVSQVLVDGEAISLSTYPSSYTFSNVDDPHNISVSSTQNIYSANTATNTTIANSTAAFSSYWQDGIYQLSGYIFSTNNTGTWTNSTWTSFAATPSWANETATLNSTLNLPIGYIFYANDTGGNWANTGIQSFTTTGYTITASSDSHSSVSPESVTVCAGASQSFTLSAFDGYTVETVIINGSYSAATTSPYTFTDIQGDQSIAVSTSTEIYYINATSDGGSVITYFGAPIINPIAVPYGNWANFTCAAYPNYQLYALTVNGTSVGPVAGYHFMPTGNTTLALTSVSTVVPTTGGGGGYQTIIVTPAPTTDATTEPKEATEADTASYNFYFVVGVIALAVLLIGVFFSQGAHKAVKKEITSWNTD